MRKRYSHIASIEQYRFRNRFSHTTNITTTTQTSPNANDQVLLDDSMDFHENYSNDDELSKFDNEDEYENEENEENEKRHEENENEDYDDYYEEDEIDDYDDDYDGKEDEEKDDDNDDEFLEDPIIDASFDRNQMSHTNGSFSPYFKNTTSALLFCWMQKHNVCKFK